MYIYNLYLFSCILMLYRAPVDTSPVTEGVTLFKHQLYVHGSVVDCIDVNSSACPLKLCPVQCTECVRTNKSRKVGTVLNGLFPKNTLLFFSMDAIIQSHCCSDCTLKKCVVCVFPLVEDFAVTI